MITSAGPPAAGLERVVDWASNLSIGEQQRLAWARLLLARPRLALLDEATSALDQDTEAKLYQVGASGQCNGSKRTAHKHMYTGCIGLGLHNTLILATLAASRRRSSCAGKRQGHTLQALRHQTQTRRRLLVPVACSFVCCAGASLIRHHLHQRRPPLYTPCLPFTCADPGDSPNEWHQRQQQRQQFVQF